jgi:NADH dehydrogenase FAD-containing subunit
MADPPAPRPSVVVVGSGYGGINTAKALDDVADVTLIDPTEAFVHNIAAWRALVEPEWLERIFLPYEHLLAHGHFLRDRAVAIDGRRVTLASGDVLEPDYLVLATGSAYPFPAKTEEPDIAFARARHRAAHEALLAADRALIVGAGPSGLELAGEIKAFFPDADRDAAGIANAQAGVVAANVRALITGTGQLTSYETFPPMIAIPLGPEGGAGFLGDGVADAATIADLKGRHMGMDRLTALFDAAPPLAA